MAFSLEIVFGLIGLSLLELRSGPLYAQTADAKKEDVLTAPAGPAFVPAESTGGIPVISTHSELQSTVYQGDKIILGVNATGEKLLYRWVRNYKTICTGSNCRFDSSRWGVGAQNITVVIYNNFGSQTVNFMVRVLARPIDQAFSEVEPKTVRAEKAEALSAKDFFVKAVYGIGYSFKDRSDVRIVAQLPRAISWSESVRSHVEGLVQFGVKQKEEHLVLPGSSVVLQTSDENRRIIQLTSGTVRSRQLALDLPSWSVTVGTWLQVDGDAKADLIVSTSKQDPKKVTVTVLRGNARVLLQKNDREPPLSIYMYPGISQVYAAESEAVSDNLSASKSVEKIVRQSTPQYFLKKNEGKGRVTSFVTPDISKKINQAPGDAIIEAKAALDDDDAISALEALLPIYLANKQLYELNFQLANAYGQLGAFKEAFRYYKEAARLEPKNPEPPYQMGMLYIRSGSWVKAIEALKAAQSLKHPNQQNINYQLGVSEFNLGHSYSSRSYFRYAQWQAQNAELKASTDSYLKIINDRRWFGAFGRLRVGKDSNVFRWGGGGRTDGYETESSLYYRGGLDMFIRAYESEQGEMLFGFDIDKTIYTASGASDLSPLVQKLYMTWLFNAGISAGQKPAFQADFRPFIQLFSLGDERSADDFGLNLTLGSPRLTTSPYLRILYATSSDPLPARDDKVDPLLREPVVPSDRSSKITGYGLGFDFLKNPAKKINLELLSKKVEHNESVIKVDDFKEMSLTFRTKSLAPNNFGFLFDAGYLKRSFAASDDSRKDTAFALSLGVQYLFTSTISSDFCIDYLSQKSNRSISSYNRNDMSLGLSIEL